MFAGADNHIVRGAEQMVQVLSIDKLICCAETHRTCGILQSSYIVTS